METKSTKTLFALAREKSSKSGNNNDNNNNNNNNASLREAIEMFTEVFQRCESAGCFDEEDASTTTREEREDRGGEHVSTTDLKYALCWHFVGKCWQTMRTEFAPLLAEGAKGEDKGEKTTMVMNRKQRVEHVLRAKECFERFLRFATAARFVPSGFEKEARAAVGLMDDDEEEERREENYDGDRGTTMTAGTPEAKRTMKVKRFKKQSELRRKLEEMEKSGVAGEGSALVQTTTGADEEEEEEKEEAPPDEEKVREYWFAMIEKAVLDSIEMIEGSKEEVALLTGVSEEDVRRIVQEGEKKQHRGEQEDASSSSIPAELLKAIASLESNNIGRNGGMMNRSAPTASTSAPTMMAMPSLPSSLFANRKESVVRDARSALFRPSHILPTMSIEEAGEIELRELMERTALSNEREKRKSILEIAKTEDELSDEKLYEKRRWDDWKDDNPFGAGNSRRTPTGNNK